MIFRWTTVPSSSWGMLMAIPVMVMPDGANIARIGFKKELRHRVDPGRVGAADRALLNVRRLLHRALPVKAGSARRAGVLIRRHELTSRSQPPWWHKLGLTSGRTISELPFTLTYYMGTEGERPGADSKDQTSLL